MPTGYSSYVLAPNLDGWTLVLAGFWNPAIFSPPWVGARLFEADVLETMVPLTPNVPVVFRDANAALRVSPTRLEISPRRIDDDALRSAEKVAITALQVLSETPVNAVGINFGFREDAPSADLLEQFNFRDAGRWGGQGWNAQQREINRRFERNGSVLNLKLTFDSKVVAFDFDFNFNFSVDSARTAAERLRDQTIHHRELAFMILNEVFDLTVGTKQ